MHACTSFFDTTGMSCRKIPATEWTRGTKCRGRGGRGSKKPQSNSRSKSKSQSQSQSGGRQPASQSPDNTLAGTQSPRLDLCHGGPRGRRR
ncbi:hypothetical protein STPYR_12651 [uncultured Stenotrophomonas sp.]|uniref:Uncharacterized protein n=1 Tax=uncultured Stenotrophomonas sp. TaxID=165438 RepID=A0A1Y5Q5X8_9GAMM|nr:hypothetical protein STPYR_12651 [uncultured Stenotrophomonas sp.]